MPRLRRRTKQKAEPYRVDGFAITATRARSLAELIANPTRYAQRFVEQLSFLPNGGQQWVRTLQVQVPQSGSPNEPSWWVVPLGQFSLRRFADIFVTDSTGKRLELLTRRQHGLALTKATLAKHIFTLPPDCQKRLREGDNDARRHYYSLRALLHEYFTSVSEVTRERIPPLALGAYRELLVQGGVRPDEIAARERSLLDDFADTKDTTQYLCWVRAEPSQIVNLQASYTVTDPKHKLERKGLWRATRTFLSAFSLCPSNSRSKIWSEWYRQYGLAPLNYQFSIPTYWHSGSYYFTLEAPAKSYVTYLDWETGNSIEKNGEVDCAHPSAHIHNEAAKVKARGGSGSRSGRTMRAYLRCAPHHHKQILGTALLNIALVWLLTTEAFPRSINSPLSSVLLVTPSFLIAYLVRQQRHYFAHAMRRQRAILWGYLVISLVFLISVAFSVSGGTLTPTASVEVAAWALAISSAMIFVWHLPLGYGVDRVVEWLTNRKWDDAVEGGATQGRKGGRVLTGEEKWTCYNEAVAQYSRWIVWLVVAAVFATVAILYLKWDIPVREQASNGGTAYSESVPRNQAPRQARR